MRHSIVRAGLLRVFYPCLMIFGTIGNILCLKILLHKRFRRQSTCQYLCILAVIDIIFIHMRSARFLYRHIYHVDVRNVSLWICRTYIFLSSTLSHLASWILVIVSFDRYFIIKKLFSRRHVGWSVTNSTCVLILAVSLLNIYYFRILGTEMVMNMPNAQKTNNISNETVAQITRFVCIAHSPFKEFFHLYVPIFDLLFVAIIPFCLMTFTNIGIIRKTMRSNMLYITSRKQKRNNRVTIMLLSVILAFMLLTCPSVIYICLNRLKKSTAISNTKLVVLDLLESLWYTKHALNFVLYTLSGQDFRREFFKLLHCYRRKSSHPSINQQNDHNDDVTTYLRPQTGQKDKTELTTKSSQKDDLGVN
ncbi:unnamed protein product [Rotaria magnacalcarata]|uniref:G-protein coupled receptors family 1 profile domain-containing protein n=3 Tax=Rotaria magnacalcarata TaxID=392030 RepID=A0A819TTU6_9BILA|nr:unnamed protein product [Rotaria magnacalcarata]CAF1379771.1 unnamed protein product [Rotaria magnacalcarata]CAF2074771.1 unnamed protein product [Rotaria magnacalcarata]CAF2145781.1 unnamed protein product [Rotaria magnacalcarata]CAF4038442.1 unnamed protein product [Rotaria magnacalcarata]